MSLSKTLKGKRAIITGGTRGLGKATALAFAKEGINVALTGRNEKALETVVEELKTYNVEAMYSVFDISNYQDTQKGIKTITDAWENIDILINNAGIAAFGSVSDMDVEQWTQIINTNLLGMYYVTKEVLPFMLKNNEGDIFNVSSTAGLNGNAKTSAYSASKFGVIGFSQSLMKEVRKNNIRVCTLTPSTIVSDMSRDLGIINEDTLEHTLQPEDFAELIVASLKLPRRAMLKDASLWTTNP